eukprot:jgi/Mesvir1/7901/Mv11831-RA.1
MKPWDRCLLAAVYVCLLAIGAHGFNPSDNESRKMSIGDYVTTPAAKLMEWWRGTPPSVTSDYVRPPKNQPIPLSQPLLRSAGDNTPEQMHVTLWGPDKMAVVWITDSPPDVAAGTLRPPSVQYGLESGILKWRVLGSTTTYTKGNYTSGHIHQAILPDLLPGTRYYYRCNGNYLDGPELNFTMPPAVGRDATVVLGVVGDLGQTENSLETLRHVEHISRVHAVLYAGDLSYADGFQPRWDSWGRLVQPIAGKIPFMTVAGNHEMEIYDDPSEEPFLAYLTRWPMPYQPSGSSSSLWYSFDIGPVHCIMLCSYAAFGDESSQYKWLEKDLSNVDRVRTPWVVAVMHAPWYNSNTAHQGEVESFGMKAVMEEPMIHGGVDLIIAGHVHAYERTYRVYEPATLADGTPLSKKKHHHKSSEAPYYLIVGDGGNREGIAGNYIFPQPKWSAFREASYGHGRLEVFNQTHALWTWIRNTGEPFPPNSTVTTHRNKHHEADTFWRSRAEELLDATRLMELALSLFSCFGGKDVDYG